MRTLIDLCTCTDRPKAFGRSLHQLMVVMGVAVAFAISGNALACDPGSCVGFCGGQSPDGCWCDDFCATSGDCCEDKAAVCGGPTSCVAGGGECDGNCGGLAPSGCWCDETCCSAVDCCPGKFDDCGGCDPGNGGGGGECAGNCGGLAPSGCWCDETCCTALDCCPGKFDDCGGCDPGGNGGECVCTTPQGGPGCPGFPECEAAVCACDPFCCDVEWDGFCASTGFPADCLCPDTGCGALNTAECCGPPPDPDCGVGGTGNCCEDNGTPYCNDAACCDLVCNQDPFCCDEEWDSICADIANADCAVCQAPVTCGPGAGPCCSANGTPGCEDEACCDAVCACDPFCCDSEWDSFCASTGFAPDCLCPDTGCGALNTAECDCVVPEPCPPGAAGDCCVAHGQGPGCEDPDCCNMICNQDPFCCDVSWDGLCAGAAVSQCGVCRVDGPEKCCTPHGGIGCPEDPACEACVCANDAFCCDVAWDGLCAGIADSGACAGECLCGETVELCPESDLSCCEAHPAGNPGCNDPDCCELICTADPFCCNTNWDGLCANAANNQCEVCEVDPEGCSLGFWKNHTENWSGYSPDDIFDEVFGSDVAATSNCCSSQCIPTCAGAGNPTGCDDPDCTAAVCAADSFCCNTGWDGLCASAAANTHCVALCAGGAAPLGVMGDATLLEVISSPSGGPNSVCPSRQDCNLGKQAVAALLNAAAGIAYPLTEDEVKDAVASAFDSSDRNAKEALKDELDAFNNLGCPEFAAADLNQDEMVNVFDLLEVLGDWGQTAVPADINRDGIVNVFDLLKVLANWGPAPVEWVPTNELR